MPAACNCPYKKFTYCDYPKCLTRHKQSFKGKRRDFSKIVRGYRTIGGREIYFRSLWEMNFARVLQWHLDTKTPFKDKILISWAYEPETFIFHAIQKGTRSYKPDFKVVYQDGQTSMFDYHPHFWCEVKGYLKPQDRTKLNRMAKYYPAEVVHVIDGTWFKANIMFYRSTVPGWEDHPDS